MSAAARYRAARPNCPQRPGRTTIFGLEPPPTTERGVGARVLEICAEASRSLGFEPEARFVGPIEGRVPDRTATELVATLREVLSNVARHARTGQAEVEVSVRRDLHLRVLDDGIGTPHTSRRARASTT